MKKLTDTQLYSLMVYGDTEAIKEAIKHYDQDKLTKLEWVKVILGGIITTCTLYALTVIMFLL